MRKIANRYISLYILLIPIFRYYDLPCGSNVYFLLLNICALIFFVSEPHRYFNSISKITIIFLIWILFTTAFAYMFSPYGIYIQSTSINNLIIFEDCAIILLIVSACKSFDYDYFVKAYKWISLCIIFYLLYQFYNFFILGRNVEHLFSFFKLNIEGTTTDSIRTYSGGYGRFSSVFREPSHLSQYLTPLVVFYLYGYKGVIKKNVRYALLVSACMIFSISGTGIAINIIVWFIFLVRNCRNISIRKLPILIFYLFVGICLCIVALGSVGISTMISEMSDSNDNKTLDRVSRGFLIFEELPVDKQIIGIGYQCVSAATKVYGLKYGNIIANGHNEYLSDVTSILVTGGLLGFIYVIYILMKIVRFRSEPLLLMSLAVVGILCSEATLGTLTLFYILMILSYSRIYRSKCHIKNIS